MLKAIEAFSEQEKGILNIIRAADVYALYVLANIRNQEPEKDVINEIIKSNKISGLNLFGWAYKGEEIKILEKNKHLQQIGQQILLATYTAFEIYLIEKFKEYYKYLMNNKDDDFVDKTIKKFSFRSLKEIKSNYFDLLKIYLPSYDIDYESDDNSTFQPKTSWEAITLISLARNEIAHKGYSEKYKIITLMDSWYPFDFVRRWVNSFDANFDTLIYEKHETGRIREYKKGLNKISKNGSLK
jgi:hypothetical protein